MTDILQRSIFKYIFLTEYLYILIQISLKFIRKSLIDNKSSLVQVMAWCQTGKKQWHDQMFNMFYDMYNAIWHHLTSMNYI